MHKFNLFCPIRVRNPYKRIAKSKLEATTKPNLLNRDFKANGPRSSLLTDIIYLFYLRGKKAIYPRLKIFFNHLTSSRNPQRVKLLQQ